MDTEETKSALTRLSRTHSVALQKFPPLEQENAKRKLGQEGFKFVNVPSANNPEKIIVVSFDGSFKHGQTATRFVVNPLWVNEVDTNSAKNLSKYTFGLAGLNFMAFGSAAVEGRIEAEMALWR